MDNQSFFKYSWETLPKKWVKKMERSEHGNRSDTNSDYLFHPLLARSEATVAATVDSVDSSSPRLTLSSIADPEPSVKLLFYPELSAKVASSSLLLNFRSSGFL